LSTQPAHEQQHPHRQGAVVDVRGRALRGPLLHRRGHGEHGGGEDREDDGRHGPDVVPQQHGAAATSGWPAGVE
jgi:hypothetical protein